MDNYYDIEEPQKGFTVGKLIKWLIAAMIFGIYAILVVRCTMYQDDQIIEKIIVNDTTLEAYYPSPETFRVEQYGMNSAWVAVSEGRLVEFKNLYYMPQSHQLQLGVKYNTDIAPYMAADGLPIRFYLTDSHGNEYRDYFFEQKEKFDHNYVRVCFNQIDLIDPKGIPDENGNMSRLKFTLHIEKLEADHSYSELCNYRIYDGSTICKLVPFSAK